MPRPQAVALEISDKEILAQKLKELGANKNQERKAFSKFEEIKKAEKDAKRFSDEALEKQRKAEDASAAWRKWESANTVAVLAPEIYPLRFAGLCLKEINEFIQAFGIDRVARFPDDTAKKFREFLARGLSEKPDHLEIILAARDFIFPRRSSPFTGENSWYGNENELPGNVPFKKSAKASTSWIQEATEELRGFEGWGEKTYKKRWAGKWLNWGWNLVEQLSKSHPSGAPARPAPPTGGWTVRLEIVELERLARFVGNPGLSEFTPTEKQKRILLGMFKKNVAMNDSTLASLRNVGDRKTVGKETDILEKAGLVRRIGNSKRAGRCLTDAGKKLAEKIRQSSEEKSQPTPGTLSETGH